jgi:hypothetical protein
MYNILYIITLFIILQWVTSTRDCNCVNHGGVIANYSVSYGGGPTSGVQMRVNISMYSGGNGNYNVTCITSCQWNSSLLCYGGGTMYVPRKYLGDIFVPIHHPFSPPYERTDSCNDSYYMNCKQFLTYCIFYMPEVDIVCFNFDNFMPTW